jgi:hypothetical protein
MRALDRLTNIARLVNEQPINAEDPADPMMGIGPISQKLSEDTISSSDSNRLPEEEKSQ